MSKKTLHKLFEIRKYRAVWAIKSPFTGQIIPAGNIGNVTYLVEYRGIRKYHMHLVVLPTEQLTEQLNGSTND